MKLAVPLLLIILALAAYFTIRPSKTETPKAPLENEGAASVQSSVNPLQDQLPVEANNTRIKRTGLGLSVNTNVDREEIEQKVEALAEASAKGDSDAFQLIITALKDPRPEIRKAALEATIQLGSRDAIPVLKELAAKTEDPREKVEILDAIEFLELPSLSEIKRPRRTNSNPAAVNGTSK